MIVFVLYCLLLVSLTFLVIQPLGCVRDINKLLLSSSSSSLLLLLLLLLLPFLEILNGFFHLRDFCFLLYKLFNDAILFRQLGITERLIKIRWSLPSDFWKHTREYNPLIHWVDSREELHFSDYSLSRCNLIVCLFL